MACPRSGLASQPFLEGSQIRHRHHPSEPAAALLTTGAHCLAEDGFLRSRMVQNLDDLDVPGSSQWQDPVAGAESGMDTAVDERGAQFLSHSGSLDLEAFWSGCKHEVVDVHALIVDC